jgi:hypothetical protein
MDTLTAYRLRGDISMLKAWIEHWQQDSKMGLASTKGSLANAHETAVRALKELEELEKS